MLSILIPIFNFDVRPLVNDLHGQCEAAGVGYEILCFDDGSTPDFKQKNKEIWKRTNVIYREMPQNLGRSAIRNTLGRSARFEYLLFMDCDSRVVSPVFIQNYLHHAAPDCLVYGGRCYSDQPPADPALRFHWHYGRQREQSSAAERSRLPYHSFMTNNFLVPKPIFLGILFDETLRQYGHEDTLFGMELAKRQIPILHIDNPLEHIGLEPVAVFLRKTEQGIENLVKLKNEGKPVETRLLSSFQTCRHWGIERPIEWLFSALKGLIVRQLSSASPSLRLFDFYKLGLLATMAPKQTEV
ncbi:MAG: glycosyltransferase family 2 protein [Saprospiraceae bacterium]|nr:glycosyltransferase family 2 protein [Saprospiraceae bacterium]MCF8249218.1 glycosyltransferase family 2 protein [Saprospiraceae bacterium]MCF8280175.1 glycosyltransferase family 2 protein [Bacteroidales bacterium]MCF8311347.1 glycosyltransferase family 2 protein [Saprospiraceae bacterium]MCF8440089.1 glycosyltransferase family 2 protein [Saprospiraceae bacterium]